MLSVPTCQPIALTGARSPPGETALRRTAHPSRSVRPECPDPALPAGGNLLGGAGEGASEELGALFLLARALPSLSEVPGDAGAGLRAQPRRAGCCRGTVQPGVRTDPAAAAAAAGNVSGRNLWDALARLHGFACAALNTCRGFAGSAPEPEG